MPLVLYPLLAASWQRLWLALGARDDGAALRDALLAAYAEPHRHYHSLQYLGECLARFDACAAWAAQPAEVEAALWFHDAIYDTARHDNEPRSADWAHAALRDAGVSEVHAERVNALVLATRHGAAEPATPDEQLLVGIDLSILGAEPARFAEYERQIRTEYAAVPEALFKEKRRAVLQGFLAHRRIYGTAYFFERLKKTARANLTQATGLS